MNKCVEDVLHGKEPFDYQTGYGVSAWYYPNQRSEESRPEACQLPRPIWERLAGYVGGWNGRPYRSRQLALEAARQATLRFYLDRS